MESISLMGSEEVARAGYRMKEAAELMARSAATIENSNQQLLGGIDAALIRYEELVTRMESLAHYPGWDKDKRSLFEMVFGKNL